MRFHNIEKGYFKRHYGSPTYPIPTGPNLLDRFVVVVQVVSCVGGSLCDMPVRIPSILVVRGFRNVVIVEHLPQMR